MDLIITVWNRAKVFCRCAIPCVLLGAAFSQQPADFGSLQESAQAAQSRGDFEAAARYYEQASTLHPEMPELKANLGLMYYQTNKDEQAVKAFEQAIQLSPELFVPNLFLGLDYIRLRRFNQAIRYLERAARTKPDDIHVQVGLGEAYIGLGNTRLAIRAYQKGTQIEPPSGDLLYRLGVSYLDQVEADARILVTQYKDSAYFQVLKADSLAEQGAAIQASESYRRALALEGFPPDTHASVGLELLHRGDLADAERELKSELASNPGSLLAKLGLARLEEEEGSTEQAAEEIAQIWNLDAGFLISNVQRFKNGLAQARATELQTALKKLETSGELPEPATSLFRPEAGEAPLSPRPRFEMTDLKGAAFPQLSAAELYRQGAYRKCTDRLVPQLPTLSAKNLRLLALCAYGTGDYEHVFDAAERLSASAATKAEGLYWEIKSSQKLASEALAHASEIDSNSPKLHVLLGDVYRQQQRFEDAEREYHKALGLQPQDRGALFGLSLALLGDGKIDNAFQIAQDAIKVNPRDPELNAVMGEILCRREDFPEAEIYLKKSLNTKPEYISRVHALLGKVYANTNRDNEAIAELKLALPEDKDGHIHYQIGRLYLKVGDRDSAQRAFLVSKRLESEGLHMPDGEPSQNQGNPDSR